MIDNGSIILLEQRSPVLSNLTALQYPERGTNETNYALDKSISLTNHCDCTLVVPATTVTGMESVCICLLRRLQQICP
jgi:hypothetical protein